MGMFLDAFFEHFPLPSSPTPPPYPHPHTLKVGGRYVRGGAVGYVFGFIFWEVGVGVGM